MNAKELKDGKAWFLAGGSVSFLISLLHLVIIFIGTSAYNYFGAGEEMVSMSEKGMPIPAIVTAGIAAVFFLFGLYAFSAAGKVRPLPATKVLLTIITIIYLFRGLAFVFELVIVVFRNDFPAHHLAFSFVALVAGLIHLTGLRREWRSL